MKIIQKKKKKFKTINIEDKTVHEQAIEVCKERRDNLQIS
jgi:hypothetical protein